MSIHTLSNFVVGIVSDPNLIDFIVLPVRSISSLETSTNCERKTTVTRLGSLTGETRYHGNKLFFAERCQYLKWVMRPERMDWEGIGLLLIDCGRER